MKKVFIPLCMLLVLCVALSGCATATGSSTASVPTATNSMQSVPSTGTSETISKQNSQSGSGGVSDETPDGTYISDETADRIFEDYALLYYRDALCGHTWDDPSQIDTESLIQFYWVNKARESYAPPTGDDLMIHVPAADLEGYIISYFNVDPQYLETDQSYNTNTECYDLKYPDGLGMYYPEYVKAEKKDNIIDFYLGNTDYKKTMLVNCRLKVELKKDGSFRYIAGESYEPGVPVSDSKIPMGNN